MIYGSVCSGIEAASVAWHPLGWQAQFYSEIEPFPCATLAHHYPRVPNYGDMNQFQEWPNATALDVLVGGTPCQSFSVAGLRRGLADPRGNLTLVFLALAERYRPRWLVWENVPGVLSDEGGAFGAFIGGLGELGYGFAYRILDAQYFGVPQRRRRVFVVGHLGNWRAAAAVLFERYGLSGDLAPRRETGQRIAGTLAARTSGGGGLGTDMDLSGGVVAAPAVAGTLNPGAHPGAYNGQDAYNDLLIPAVSPALKARDYKGPSSDGDGDGVPLIPIAFSCKDYAQDASEISPTLRAMGSVDSGPNGGGQVAIAFNLRGRDGGAQAEVDTDGLANIRAASGGSSRTMVATMAVRRLTPRECERLQGFPDDYTLIHFRHGKPAADGPRYKALGNSMAVPVMAWIGKRIKAVEAIIA